jgi:hypothetical protein
MTKYNKLMSAFRTKSSDLEDEFVQRVIKEKGTFLDVGCGYGGPGNNTLVLEEEGWKGTMADSNQQMMQHNSTLRKCRLCVADLTKVNWFELLSIPQNQELTIDYISFSSSDNVLEIVRNFPWNKIRFRVLTIKHDEVNNGPVIKEEIRRILAKSGYLMVAGDVCYDFCYKPFADWWVDPVSVPVENYLKYVSYGVRGIEVLYKEKRPSGQKYITRSADLQDEFALRLLGPKGRFLDIGCGHGLWGNNSIVLEEAGWNGIMIDLDMEAWKWNQANRRAKSVCDDVTNCDWNTIIGKKPEETVTIDFISFDVDDATVPAVQHFPWSTVRFRVMTIEHDAYRVGPATRAVIRDTLAKHGYMLLAGDVCADIVNKPYEDWYIDPLKVDPSVFLQYASTGLRAAEVIYTPKI